MVKVWDWLRCSHSPSYHISVSSLVLYLPRSCAGRTRWQKLPPLLVHQRTQLCPWSMLWMQFSVNVFNVPFTQWDLANLEHKNVGGEVLREFRTANNERCKCRRTWDLKALIIFQFGRWVSAIHLYMILICWTVEYRLSHTEFGSARLEL